MDRLIKWALGCALGVVFCSVSQAALIESIRVGNKAYLVSDTHLYRYSASSRVVEFSRPLAGQSVVALAVSDDALFVAYEGTIEKRNLDGVPVSDPVSGGPLTRNFPNITDVAVHDGRVYVSFQSGKQLHELKDSDLSPVAGVGAPYYSLVSAMEKLEPVAWGATGLTFFSPAGNNMVAMSWPPTLEDGAVPVQEHKVAEGAKSLPDANNLFIQDGGGSPTILMDNGAGWTLGGVHEYGWIDGQALQFADFAGDGEWTVIRNKLVTCESGEALNWGSDLVHYEDGYFSSLTKAGEAGAPFQVVHLWGSDPVAHLFREEAPGELLIDTHPRSNGKGFDDGNAPFVVEPDSPLSKYQLSQGVSRQHVALNDDATRAYVLHQGNSTCEAAIRVYNLESRTWESTIPLRWRPEAIAIVGGSLADASDDMLAVVYEVAFNFYGRSDILVSYIDINAATPKEDPAKDFSGYNVLHSGVSTVQGSRHAVLFQVEHALRSSIISAWSPQGTFDFYEDCQEGASCTESRSVDFWQSRARLGETAGLLLKVEDGIRTLPFTESESGFWFGTPGSPVTLDGSVSEGEGPMVFSPDREVFTLNLADSTAVFRTTSQAFSEGKPTDYLPFPMEVVTWSENRDADTGEFVLYSLSGGDVEGTEAAIIKRWTMALGDDGHFQFESSESASLPGKPVMATVIDAAKDELMLATVYQNQVLFTPVNRSLSNGPGFEPKNSDDGSSGDDGANFNRSGGGGIHWWFGVVLLLAGRIRLRQ